MSSSSIIKILFLLLGFAVSGQNHTVSGIVQDTKGEPLPFADVLLLNPQDAAVIASTFTDVSGKYSLNVAAGSYTLKVSAVGFEAHTAPLPLTQDVAITPILLKEAAYQLENVTVNSKRPVLRRKIDRVEFDVENSVLSSENAWEIVRKTPGVNVMGDGISIRGSSGILVTINDKKVYLTGTELKNLLENMSGDNIKSVEVITTPPAKYDAQGSAVLNIKMKKGLSSGYKGSVSGAYVQTMYPKGVISTNHYYKGEKLMVYGGYMFGSGHYYGENNGEIRYFNPDGTIASVWKSREEANYFATQQISYNLTAEYAIDSLNTISFGTNGFGSLKSTAMIDTPTRIYNGAGQLDSLYTTHNHRDYPQKNSTITGLYEHKFSDKHKIVLSSDYTKHYFNQEQDINAAFSLPDAAPHRDEDIYSNDTRRINLLSVQADYTGAAGATAFEAGMRYGTVDADNDFIYENTVNGTPVASPGLSNRFLYDESIVAGYISGERSFGKWGFKAGLRGEHTKLEGNSATTGEVNTQNYFKVFPSAYAMYKASDNHNWGLSYGKRIVRPQYAALNPFRSYNTPYFYSTGDPNLQPAISHNLSLQYTLKSKYSFEAFYNYMENPASEILYQDYATNTVVSRYTNISNSKSAGLQFNTNLELTGWWQTGIVASLNYQENSFQGADGTMQLNNALSFYGSTNNRFTLNKKKDLTAEMNFFYVSPGAQGALELSNLSSLSLSIRKIFLDGNAHIGLIFSDIYKGERQTSRTHYANQYTKFSSYGDTQSFRLQFLYRFGNQKLQDGRQREGTDEQRRL